jgi:hypothetical protein
MENAYTIRLHASVAGGVHCVHAGVVLERRGSCQYLSEAGSSIPVDEIMHASLPFSPSIPWYGDLVAVALLSAETLALLPVPA